MPLHLIKLCVGCDSVRDLQGWIRERLKDKRKRGEKPEHIHRTRMVPKRAEELTDGGSLFWVIRGEIACRQRIRDVRPWCLTRRSFWWRRGRSAPSRAGATSR
jgi:hypothetical protein